MPFYSRIGFAEVPARELRTELERLVRNEADRGLDRKYRVIMRYVVNALPPTLAGCD
jgi:hypothetical protein